MTDTAQITLKAGDGGNGLVSFRREKYVARGGPWGGDGGEGGDIIFKVGEHLNTLTSFRRKTAYEAKRGGHGMKNKKKGADGENLVVKVPPGTLVKNEEGQILHDLTEIGQTITIDHGGKGGLGNWHFKSSVNQAPQTATDGETKEKHILNLELKIIADVGLIGLPSSGKSTLLNALTKANAKTAEYHFTTLEPNLGVLFTSNYISDSTQEIVLADIPGLIEGASEGKGLGHEFLKHVERTKVLVHLIDGINAVTNDPKSLLEDYQTIQTELEQWNKKLLNKPQIVIINKIDVTEVRELTEQIKKVFSQLNLNPIFISAASTDGLQGLVLSISKLYEKYNKTAETETVQGVKKTITYTIDTLKNKRIIFRR